MKRTIKYLLVSAFLFAAACNEDKGNYDYTPVNAIAIGGIDDVYNVKSLDVLTISPVLDFSAGEAEEDCTYEWIRMRGTAQELVSTERDLELEITGLFAHPGDYSMRYRVKNETSGVVYTHKFTIRTTTLFTQGFLLLCQRGDDAALDMLALPADGGEQLFRDVHLLPGDGERLDLSNRKAVDIMAYRDAFSPSLTYSGKAGANYAIWILTDKNCDRVNSSDFSWKPEYNISNMVSRESKLSGNIVPTRMDAAGATTPNARLTLFMIDGNWYSYSNDSWGTWLINMHHNQMSAWDAMSEWDGELLGTFPVSPYFAARHDRGVFFFDESAHKIVIKPTSIIWNYGMGDMATSMYCINIPYIINWEWGMTDYDYEFDNPAHDLVYMSNCYAAADNPNPYSANANLMWAVVRDNDRGIYRLLDFQIVSPLGDAEKFGVTDFAFDEIGRARFFGRMDFGYLYYVTPDHRVKSVSTTSPNAMPQDISEGIVPAGHEVVVFKKFRDLKQFSDQSVVDPVNMRDMIYVVTRDPSLPDDRCCTLALYYCPANTLDGKLQIATYKYTEKDAGGRNVASTKEMRFSGLGNVVAVTPKEM